MREALLGTATLLVLDFLWLGLYMTDKYHGLVKSIQGSPMRPNLLSAAAAYTLMVVGLLVFVVPNIRKEYRVRDSLYYGGIFGLVLYGVYDFTAGGVFKNWDFSLAFIDVIWGFFVYSAAAYASSL